MFDREVAFSVQFSHRFPSINVWNTHAGPGSREEASNFTWVAPDTVNVACTPSHEKDTLPGEPIVRPDHVAADASSWETLEPVAHMRRRLETRHNANISWKLLVVLLLG
jgi:hypothetical protein